MNSQQPFSSGRISLSPQAKAELTDRVMNIFLKQYNKRVLMTISKAFRRWAYEFPLNVKCTELMRQLKERNSVLETVRGCYLKDVISLKHQLDKLNKLANSASNVTKAQIEDSIYELHTLPSIDLRNVIEKAETCFKQSSVQLQNNLIEAGIMDPISGRTYNPWDHSRAYRRMKRLETGGSFGYPTSMGESYPLAAPRQYQLIVHYCSQCIGFISFVKKWNEEVEESIRFRTEYYSVDTKIEDFKRVIKNLHATIEEKETENIYLLGRVNELENANQWFEKWTLSKNTAELQSFFQQREKLHQQQLEMLLADKASALKEMSDKYEAQIAQLLENETRLRQQLSDKDDELQKEVEWRYQLNNQIDTLTSEKEKLQHTIQSLQKNELNQKEEYDALQSKYSSLEKLKNDLLRSITQYELDLAKQRQDMQIKMQQYQAMLKQMEAQIQSLENTNSVLVQELREKKQQANKSESALQSLQDELAALQELLKKYQYKCPRLKRAVLAVICILRLFRHLKRKDYSQLSAIGYRVAAYQKTKEAFRMNDDKRDLQDKYDSLQSQYLALYERNLQYQNGYSEFDFIRMQLESKVERLKEELAMSREQCKDLEDDYNILKQQFQNLHGIYMQEKESMKNVHYVADLESVYTRIKIFGHLQRNLSIQCLRGMFRIAGMIEVLDIPIHMRNLSVEKKLLIQDDPELYQYYQEQEKSDRLRDVQAKKVNDRLDKDKEAKRKNAQFKRGPRKNKKISPDKRTQIEMKSNGMNRLSVVETGKATRSTTIATSPIKRVDPSTGKVIVEGNTTVSAGGSISSEGSTTKRKDFSHMFRTRGNRLITSFQMMKKIYPVFLNMKPVYQYWIHWIRHGRTLFNPTAVAATTSSEEQNVEAPPGPAPEEEIPIVEEPSIASPVSAIPTPEESKNANEVTTNEPVVDGKDITSEETKDESSTVQSEDKPVVEVKPEKPKLPPPPNDALLQEQCNKDAEAVENISKVLIKDMKMVSEYIQELRETILCYSRRLSKFSQLQQDHEKLQQQYQWAQMQLNRSSAESSRRQQILKIRNSTAHMLNQDASSYLVTMLQAIDQVKDDYGPIYSGSNSVANTPSRSNSIAVDGGPTTKSSLFSPTMIGSSQTEKRGAGSILINNARPSNVTTPNASSATSAASATALSGNTNTFLNMPNISTKITTTSKLNPTIHAIEENSVDDSSLGSKEKKQKQRKDLTGKSIDTVDANPIKPSAMALNSSSYLSEGVNSTPLNDSSFVKDGIELPTSGNVSELEEEHGESEGSMVIGGELDVKSVTSSPSVTVVKNKKKPPKRLSSGSANTVTSTTTPKASSIKKTRSRSIILPETSLDSPTVSSKEHQPPMLEIIPPPVVIPEDTNDINTLIARYTMNANRTGTGGGDRNTMVQPSPTNPDGSTVIEEVELDELEVAQQEALLLLKRDMELKQTIANYQSQCDDYDLKIKSLYDSIYDLKEESRQKSFRNEELRDDLRILTESYETLNKENAVLRDIIHDDYRYHSTEVQKALEDIRQYYKSKEQAYVISLQKVMKHQATQIACSVCAIREYGFTPQDILLTHEYDEHTRALFPRTAAMTAGSNVPSATGVHPMMDTKKGVVLMTVTSGLSGVVQEEPSIVPVAHEGMSKAYGNDVVLIARPYRSVHPQHRTTSPPHPLLRPPSATTATNTTNTNINTLYEYEGISAPMHYNELRGVRGGGNDEYGDEYAGQRITIGESSLFSTDDPGPFTHTTNNNTNNINTTSNTSHSPSSSTTSSTPSLPFVEKVLIAVNRNYQHYHPGHPGHSLGHHTGHGGGERSKSPKPPTTTTTTIATAATTTPVGNTKQRPSTANAIVKPTTTTSSSSRPPSASAAAGGYHTTTTTAPSNTVHGIAAATSGGEGGGGGVSSPTPNVGTIPPAPQTQEQSQHMLNFAMSLLRTGKPQPQPQQSLPPTTTTTTMNNKKQRPHSAAMLSTSHSTPAFPTVVTHTTTNNNTNTHHVTSGHYHHSHPQAQLQGVGNLFGGDGTTTGVDKGDKSGPTYITSATVKLTSKHIPPQGRVTVESNGGMFYSESPFLSASELQHTIASKFRKIKQIPPTATPTFTGVTSVAAVAAQEKKEKAAAAKQQRPASANGGTTIHREATDQRTISNTAAYLQHHYHLDKHQDQTYQANALYKEPVKQGDEAGGGISSSKRPWSASRPISASFKGMNNRMRGGHQIGFTDEDENIYEDISGYIDGSTDEYI